MTQHPNPVRNPDKHAIRADMRRRRREFVSSLEPTARAALEEQLAELLSPLLASAKVVGAYCPIGGEISPLPAIARAKRLGRTIVYPAFEGDEDCFTFRAGDPAIPGPHRIPQPGSECAKTQPDLVLVPLVAVGNHGVRIGQGKGHFDRVLPTLDDAIFCGIGWQMQRLDRDIPAEDWDVPLDLFISPRGIEDFR